jgi:protocatechuate 3,4-dioxygenase beta subunit
LGQTETSLIEGTASQCCNFSDGTVNNRWGDYSAMTIDPDGCTFWYTTEYYQSPQPHRSPRTTGRPDRLLQVRGCTPNASALQGSVTSSATGNPIAGATVTIGTSSTTTDAGGQYTIGSLTPGTYNATASAPGYTVPRSR